MIALKQMAVLFAIMMLGYLACRAGYLPEAVNQKISAIVVNFANPALILTSVGTLSGFRQSDLLLTAAAAAAVYGFLAALSLLLPRLLRVPKEERSVYRLMILFNNVGFMGLPLVQSLYGSSALLYMSVFLLFYNILIYTLGVRILRGKSQAKKDFPQTMRSIFNPGVIACILAVLIVEFHISISDVGTSVITMMGNLTAPLSMMCIGASFGTMRMKQLFENKRMLLLSAIKLLAVPVAGILLLQTVIHNSVIIGVAMVTLATPIGSMTTMMAQEYHADYSLTAQGVALSTLFSVVTIPLVAAVL